MSTFDEGSLLLADPAKKVCMGEKRRQEKKYRT